MSVAVAVPAFVAGALVSLAVSWVLVSRLERVGERLGLSEALLGIVAALAAAFSVIDLFILFILNALTLITEFIGITLAAGYLGVPKVAAVALAAAVVVGAAFRAASAGSSGSLSDSVRAACC